MTIRAAMVCLLLASAALAQETPQLPTLDAAEIVRRSVAANEQDWKQLPHYDYMVREMEPRGGSKTYLSRMILGSRYEELVAINNESLSPQAAANEKHKYENELHARQNESPERRQERIERFEKDRKRNEFFMSQLGDAFDFTLVKTDTINGRPVYVLSARPRPSYHPPNAEAKALTGMQGTMWIDGADFHWVKVEAKVVHPVSIEGFLARVMPGTRFELDQVRVGQDVWLPSRFVMRSRAKVLLLFSHNSSEEETYSGYRRNNAVPGNTTVDPESLHR